ncbi:hypothetical protein MITS9509_01916 [Synechococcus sp. MIT S9509]|nr:hypothetical protein MITS9504_01715 [Synechococcus sp. MIT S9504]KZR91995.1 hypothetical protein MITS9509_01916 [Synechococcus sp. MIT S9509]
MPILLQDASVIAAPSGTFDSNLFRVTSLFLPLPEMDKSFAIAPNPKANIMKLSRIALRILMTNRTAFQAIATQRNSDPILDTF